MTNERAIHIIETLKQKIEFEAESQMALTVAIHALWSEVERKTEPQTEREGEWIVHFDDLFPEESTEECSVCHAEQTLNGNDDNFCPNCGAKMKGAEE